MPDWTYHPLSPIVASVLGEHRTRVWAMKALALLVTRAGGSCWIPLVFDHAPVPTQWQGRFGATVPPSIACEAIAVLPVQGAGVVEIAPVGIADVPQVRAAAVGRRCRVTALAATPAAADAVAPYVDAVSVLGGAGVVRLSDPAIAPAVRELADPATTVLATPAVLIEAGPGWFNRVIEAATPTTPPKALRDIGFDPRAWPAWIWGALTGLGLVVAGIGAAAIALGPVLLWYDRDYLGQSVHDLHQVNQHLIGFLQHDRLTMAGNMIGIGILYSGLAWGGIREGHRWARNALLISGAVAFLTYFYFLVTGFLEPLHTLVVVTLFPMLVLAVWRAPSQAHWPRTVGPVPHDRRRRRIIRCRGGDFGGRADNGVRSYRPGFPGHRVIAAACRQSTSVAVYRARSRGVWWCIDGSRAGGAADQHVGLAPRRALGVVVTITRMCVRHRAGLGGPFLHWLHAFRALATRVCVGGGDGGSPRLVEGIPHRVA